MEAVVEVADGDMALDLAKAAKEVEFDAKEDKKLLRKIDWFICPLMSLVYGIQYMDKVSNSYASIMGIREDLGMHGSMYSWTGTAFYLGYLAFEFPASLMLQRFPIAKFCGINVVIWGVVLCSSASVQNYASFEALRVLLGMLESTVTPAFVLITAQWYRKEEQFMRTSVWFSCIGIGEVLGGLVAYGLYSREQNVGTPLESWRLLFITVGVITVFLGFCILLHLPDTPDKAWFLNEKEKLMVVQRIRSNQQGFGNRHFKWYQFKEVFMDVRTYLNFFFAISMNIPNGGITNFSALMISALGYTNERSLLMDTPTGAVQIVGMCLCGYIAQVTQKRMAVGLFSATCILLLSGCLLAFPSSYHAQLAGYYLYAASPAALVCVISCIQSNCAGHTKKVVVNALLLIGYCVGNLIGPQTFIESQAPHYPGAKVSIVVCECFAVIFICLIWYVNWRANRIRDREDKKLPPEIENPEFADLTDFENPEFRYAT